jgi:long-chain acyl-CoA synthetase
MQPASSAHRQHQLIPLAPVERDTIPKLFMRGVDRFDRPNAMLFKEAGEWKPISHREVEARAARVAAALEMHGIEPGDRVALLSENRPEWAITDYAVTGMSAVDVPIYPTLPANQVQYILADCGARAIAVSSRQQLAKILEIRAQLPELRLIVSFESPGDAPGVTSFADLLEEGRRAIAEGKVGTFRERALRVQRDDIATLIYTSGTTGQPKGVMLSHFNLASNVAGCLQHGLSDMVREGDTTLSFLPLSHVFERTVDYIYWDVGATIAYAESIDKVADNLGEVRPNIAVAVPRVFEKIYAKATTRTGIAKKLVDWAARVGMAAADLKLSGKTPGGALALQYRVADRLVFSKLRARTGDRIRCFVSGGAPLSAEIARFFYAAGLPIYEGYGLTETSPVIAVNRPDAVKLGTVGRVIPGAEVTIEGEHGEILTRGPSVMLGYWMQPEATAEMIDAGGWLHTGDIGELDADGFLRITDRLKNLIVTAGGKNVAPQPIENAAAMSPFVSQLVMLGDRRPFTVLLVVPDWDHVAAWASAQGMITDRAALARDPAVTELLARETLSRLHGFARYELPKKVIVIEEEFTIENGLLTPTLKVKRKAVEAKYRDRIEAAYSGERDS